MGAHGASYHDRLSHYLMAEETQTPYAPPRLLTHSYASEALARALSLTGACYDHFTQYALPDGPRQLMQWDILPNRRHWVEAGRVDPYGVIF